VRDGITARVWWALVPALLAPGGFSLVYFVLASDSTLARGSYAAAKGFLVFWPVLSVWVLLPRGSRVAAGRRSSAGSIAAGLGLAAAIVGMMALGFASPLGASLREGSESIRAKLEQFGVATHYVAFAIVFSVIHSALEEYYWRWFTYGQMRRFVAGWQAHLLAAAGFTLHHYVVLAQYFQLWQALILGTFVGVGGLLWSWSYQRWGSLLGPWLSHLVVDLAIFWFGARILGLGFSD